MTLKNSGCPMTQELKLSKLDDLLSSNLSMQVFHALLLQISKSSKELTQLGSSYQTADLTYQEQVMALRHFERINESSTNLQKLLGTPPYMTGLVMDQMPLDTLLLSANERETGPIQMRLNL